MGGGVYRVAKLEGVRERDLHDGANASDQPFTYVYLELIEAWFDAPPATVARIFGGPTAEGGSGGWSLSLRTDQEVGVLLTEPAAANRGFPYLSPIALFTEQPDNSWKNSQLQPSGEVDRDDLSNLVRTIRSSGDCTEVDEGDGGIADVEGSRP